MNSKFELVKVSEINWKFTEFQSIYKRWFFQLCYIHWDSLNFWWISEALADSKLKCILVKEKSLKKSQIIILNERFLLKNLFKNDCIDWFFNFFIARFKNVYKHFFNIL